jgi:hypothetical protein
MGSNLVPSGLSILRAQARGYAEVQETDAICNVSSEQRLAQRFGLQQFKRSGSQPSHLSAIRAMKLGSMNNVWLVSLKFAASMA